MFQIKHFITKNLIKLISVIFFISCSSDDPEDFVEVRDPTPIANQTTIVSNYTLSVTVSNGGNVSPTSGSYESGTEITLTATPNIGFIFVGWSGTHSGLNPSLTFTISDDTSINAIFEPLVYLDNNGITIEAKLEASIGLIEFNGNTYEIVSENKLREMIINGEDLSRVITSKVTNMDNLFYCDLYEYSDCPENRAYVVNGEISHWDVSNVVYMRKIFMNSTNIPSIEDWDVSNLLYADNMFNGTDLNQDLSSWNTSNLISAMRMFAASSFNNNSIANWDVSNVINMRMMFGNNGESSPFNQDISSWDVSSVTDMYGMFSQSDFDQDLSAWDVSNVTDMAFMFWETPFNQDISAWDVSSVTDMYAMFGFTIFNQDISVWDVSNVTKMEMMFYGSEFNQDISSWNVSNVTNMKWMFRNGCCKDEEIYGPGVQFVTKFNQNLSSWDVSNVTICSQFYSTSNSTWTLPKPNFTKCLL